MYLCVCVVVFVLVVKVEVGVGVGCVGGGVWEMVCGWVGVGVGG